MPLITRHCLITVLVLALASLLIIGIFVWSGIYNIGADDTHTRPVYSMLETLRERSIGARAKKLHPPPNLNDQTLVRQGAGNYNAMCMGCHLAPGMPDTELSKGLYPTPPNLTKDTVDAATAFWVIKHGIKASGMPAWGKSMEDPYIWGLVAFLQQLPKLDASQYQVLVASSSGHSHGGGETKPHAHSTEAEDHENGGDARQSMEDVPKVEAKPHSHPPGTPPHDDAAPKAPTSPHAHAPGTPPHDDTAPTTPTDEHAGMEMPEPAPAQHADDDHQH
jgi:hypothetical protein